jgi:hypothetical protein
LSLQLQLQLQLQLSLPVLRRHSERSEEPLYFVFVFAVASFCRHPERSRRTPKHPTSPNR